ncbi:radical SAM protein [bacterium]|nr:radical SAM protein [bacterium]
MIKKSTESQNFGTQFYTFLNSTPRAFQEKIAGSYNAIKGVYPICSHAMPQPLWKKRGYNDDGDQVWEKICRLFRQNTPQPVSVYVHVPFCQQKCGFCDCLSLPIKDSLTADRFVSALQMEIKAWGQLPGIKECPVTVLYFGGGTPNSLPDALFEQVLRMLKKTFQIHEDTQISVECNAHLLTPERLRMLKTLGVNRISIGVQTLQEPLRFRLGRHSSAKEVLTAIQRCKGSGFITCADVIYGLPEQNMNVFLDTLQSLIDAGIDGLSLYRFNLRQQNQEFIKKTFPRFHISELKNYVYFQAGHCLLNQAGYQKNHFIHFVRSDNNLYYRHVLRSEDLIALGPTADGVIGFYRYRHPHLKGYLLKDKNNRPKFEGGTDESQTMKTRPLTAALMCGEIVEEKMRSAGLGPLLSKWQSCDILEPSGSGRCRLTANGSWLIDPIIDEVKRALDG